MQFGVEPLSQSIGNRQITSYTVFPARQITFFHVNRVEHQKLNQPTLGRPSARVLVVQLSLPQTQKLINAYDIPFIEHHRRAIHHHDRLTGKLSNLHNVLSNWIIFQRIDR